MPDETSSPQPLNAALQSAAAEIESAEAAAPDTEEAPEPEAPVEGGEPEGEAAAGEETGAEPAEAGDAEAEAFKLSPEEESAIRSNPALAKLRKSLLRSYTRNQQRHAEAVKLAELVRADPDGFLLAASRLRGYELSKPGAGAPGPATPTPEATATAAINEAGGELEKLFGAEAGPVVRAVFEKMARSIATSAVAPIISTLDKQQGIQLASSMSAEEAAFKSRTQGITPEIEREMVTLGESGRVMPGPNMTPREYLDLLHEIVMARRSRTKASADLADRVRRAKEDAEPVRGVSSRGGVTKVSRIQPGKHSLAEALKIAEEELGR